jgi:hypothetical protein
MRIKQPFVLITVIIAAAFCFAYFYGYKQNKVKLFMSIKDLQEFVAATAVSKEEIEEILYTHRIARMAAATTIHQNGKPHIVAVWFCYDRTNVIVPSTKET